MGYNRKLILTFADLLTWTSGTGQAVIPENALAKATITLPANTAVGRWITNVVTPFAVSGQTITSFTLSLGDGSGATRHVNAVDLKTAALTAGTVAQYVYTAADTIDATATFTLSAHTIAELTAGVVEIYYDLVDLNDLVAVK